jgi:rod shape-determining protein MreC
VLSALIIAIESSTRLLEPVRNTLASIVSPIYLIAEAPYLAGQSAETVFSTNEQLREKNAQLERRLLELSQVSQQYVALKAENDRMRELLGSQARLPYEVLVAELIGVVPDTNTFQIIIDKGSSAGIEIGQAVLDADGLFGQIVEVGRFTSRVLLITDLDHAVPVRVNRNGVRTIAGGTGRIDALQLENVPISADIVEGDLIETSGLGGRFPPGYPVGRVLSVLVEPTSTYAEVTVRPLAQLDRSRHVLVIFDPTPALELPLGPSGEEVSVEEASTIDTGTDGATPATGADP